MTAKETVVTSSSSMYGDKLRQVNCDLIPPTFINQFNPTSVAVSEREAAVQMNTRDPEYRQANSTMMEISTAKSKPTVETCIPKYRRFNFSLDTPLTSNGTTINSTNAWILSKLPSQGLAKGPTLLKGESQTAPALLLTDSICKHVAHVWDLNVLAYPGTNVDDFLARVKVNKIPELKSHSFTILHVGTNNLMKEAEKTISQKIIQLARLIHAKYRSIIILSLIIPRHDSAHLNRKAHKTNQLLKEAADPAFMHCIFTHRVFLKKGAIDPTLYCTIDKIHPSTQGNRLLFKYYSTRVNEIRKGLQIPKGEHPPPPKQIIRRGDKRW